MGVHNDYRQDGIDMTFYLLTHPNGTFVKGEGRSDMDALMQCDATISSITMSNPMTPEDRFRQYTDIGMAIFAPVGVAAGAIIYVKFLIWLWSHGI